MINFIKRISCFILLVIFVDCTIGLLLDYASSNANGGYTEELNTILKEEHDVIIMGSSKAKRHYNTELIADSLCSSVYNAGLDGNGIIYMYGLFNLLPDNKLPKIIIYDVEKYFDFYEYDSDAGNTRYLNHLKRFYWDSKSIRDIFYKIDKLSSIKLLSNSYRYNGNFINVFKDYFFEEKCSLSGYEPLYGSMKYDSQVRVDTNLAFDDVKMYFFDQFIKRVIDNNIKLFIAISPKYRIADDSEYKPILEFISRYPEVTVFNHYCDTLFVDNKSYFVDPMHLNNTGANLYTNIIIDKITNLYE